MKNLLYFGTALLLGLSLFACGKTFEGILLKASTQPQYQQAVAANASDLSKVFRDSVLIVAMTADSGYQKFYTQLAKPIIKEMKQRRIPVTFHYDGPETREEDSRPLVTTVRTPMIFLTHSNLKQLGEDASGYEAFTMMDRNINNYTFSISVMDKGKNLWRQETQRLGMRDSAKEYSGFVKSLGLKMRTALQEALK